MSAPISAVNDDPVHRWAIPTNGPYDLFAILFVTALAILPLILADDDRRFLGIPFSIFFGALALRGLWFFVNPKEYELVLRGDVLTWGWAGKPHTESLRIFDVVELLWIDGEPHARLRNSPILPNVCSAVLCRGSNLRSFVKVIREMYPHLPMRDFPRI